MHIFSMALEGTHIRFALDLQHDLLISNLTEYLSGTLYPDSRYFSGIDRQLTHPKDLTHIFLKENDFKKGWAVHLLCDKLQREITRLQMPEVFVGEDGRWSDIWVRHSALKILQDIDDVRAFDIAHHIQSMIFISAPNGESDVQLEKYYSVIRKMYVHPDQLSIEVACGMWRDFGVENEYVERIRSQSIQYEQDEQVRKLLIDIYPEMVRQAKQAI